MDEKHSSWSGFSKRRKVLVSGLIETGRVAKHVEQVHKQTRANKGDKPWSTYPGWTYRKGRGVVDGWISPGRSHLYTDEADAIAAANSNLQAEKEFRVATARQQHYTQLEVRSWTSA